MSPGPPDEELAPRAAAGDLACFETLVARHRDRVYRVCLRSAGNAEDAEDWAQECFVKAYQQLARYDGGRPFSPWFYRVVANVCMNMVRGRSRARAGLAADVDACGEFPGSAALEPEAAVLSGEERRSVAAAIRSLQPPLREAVVLRVLEGMSFRDLADTFGVPLSTASTWVRRALVQVRRRLAEEGMEDTRC